MLPTTTATLIFPSQTTSPPISRIVEDLRRRNLCVRNRLLSIQHDAAFASTAAAALADRPLIANERCGSWYVAPARKAGSAYFKSTDGHAGQWAFSLRRLNLHLLRIIGECDGCIIVDSTRRGKRMPDALSKTVPLWCAVLNGFLFPDHAAARELRTPSMVVSASEHGQMSQRVAGFVEALRRLNLDVDPLRRRLSKPLAPVWLMPDMDVASALDDFDTKYHPVICCTVSHCVASGSEMAADGYIQGAGDDTENWAWGLTPELFWANAHALLEVFDESEMERLIKDLVRQSEQTSRAQGTSMAGKDQALVANPTLIPPTKQLFIGTNSGSHSSIQPSLPGTPDASPAASTQAISDPNNQHGQAAHGNLTILLLPSITPQSTWTASSTCLRIGIGPHKIGSRNLRLAIPYILAWLTERIVRIATKVEADETERDLDVCTSLGDEQSSAACGDISITIACSTGRDHAVGMAVAILCTLFDEGGRLAHRSPGSQPHTTIPPTEKPTAPISTTSASRQPPQSPNAPQPQMQPQPSTLPTPHPAQPQPPPHPHPLSKLLIRQRLGWITMVLPAANPSRATLLAVSTALLCEGREV